MKTLVISDSHGNSARAFQAHTLSEPVDAVIHLGDGAQDAAMLRLALDCPVLSVAGNCDPFGIAPREIMWECEGKRILLVHGDAYGVKTGLVRLEQRCCELQVDAVLYGHSHVARLETRSGITFLNPGTLARDALPQSYAILEISGDDISATIYSLA